MNIPNPEKRVIHEDEIFVFHENLNFFGTSVSKTSTELFSEAQKFLG